MRVRLTNYSPPIAGLHHRSQKTRWPRRSVARSLLHRSRCRGPRQSHPRTATNRGRYFATSRVPLLSFPRKLEWGSCGLVVVRPITGYYRGSARFRAAPPRSGDQASLGPGRVRLPRIRSCAVSSTRTGPVAGSDSATTASTCYPAQSWTHHANSDPRHPPPRRRRDGSPSTVCCWTMTDWCSSSCCCCSVAVSVLVFVSACVYFATLWVSHVRYRRPPCRGSH